MKRILATYIKEWHLIRRDLGGLALLFLMPILLIVIMTLVQDGPFKDYKDHMFEALFVDEDGGRVANSMKEGLLETKQFKLIETINNEVLTLSKAQSQIRSGNYKLAIIIPKGVSAEVVNNANLVANEIARKMGMGASLPHREGRDSIQIHLMFDPVTKPDFRMAIMNAVDKFNTKIQSDIVLDRVSNIAKSETADTSSVDIAKLLHSVGIIESMPGNKKQLLSKMNSVQHNVPAWAIFGMFFMVIVICDNLISERTGGSWTRLKLIPGSFAHILMGKVFFYIVLGIAQFYVMILIGMYLMPLLKLPALVVGNNPFALFAMIFSISACASTFGILVGTLFSTTHQALPVGAISVVILSAVGGVWVPIDVLPDSLKTISIISPMRYALAGVNNILLRDGGWMSIFQPLLILLSGSMLTMFLAWMIEQRRSK
ncbi:MAG: ABC transporter permease [Bacteroidetes bacterium]|nr:ABC transporter permease [Bacteroidota bacterium]